MSEEQHNCVSDGEEDPDESQIDQPVCHNDADIRKNLFDEFDVPAKKTSSDSSGREYMKAYLRIRPFSNEEIEANENQQCVEKESRTSVLMNAPKESFAFKNSTRAGGEISHRFSFTNVFDEETTQKSFFDETTLPLVTDFIHGQNCLVFTYGVTNSGKTYTIQGTLKDGGVLPRSLDVLFNSIEGKHYNRMNLKPRFCTDVTRLTDEEEHRENDYKTALLSSLDKETFDINALLKLDQDSTAELSKASCTDESALHNTINGKSQEGEHQDQPSMDVDENTSRVADDTTINVDAQGPVKFSAWVSFAEIYNETVYDLLEPCPTGKGKKRTTLRLGDDTNGNPYIKGLREIYVSNADEAYKILKIGQKNQRIASTKLNQCSSRSHCIFSVKVLRVVDVEDPHVARVSRLSFVDLAGSERYSKTQSKGDRLKEAGNINTSLMTLGKCLEYLRYNQRNPSQPLIIPFRESKLTRLFQGFFCGKGRASMIVNVNMCASMFDETFHVMKFSAIAKKVTTRVSKPVDLPPPSKKARALAPTPRSKPTRLSVPWANGALCTPAPLDDAPLVEEDEENEGEVETVEPGTYQQQLMDLVKVLQEKLIEEKHKMQTLEVKIREEVCQEMAEQLVSIEKAYSERVKMEVTAVEEKCDRRIELLTQSIKKTRKRPRIERIEEDDEEWVPSVFLHAEQTKVREKQHLISELNVKIAELRQEVKQLKENGTEETAKSEAVLELQAHLNDANEEVRELKQMLEEAGEAFTEKEAEINKLRAALDDEEACIKKQDAALKHLTAELEKVKATPKFMTDHDELSRTKGALEATMAKLADTEKQLETKDSMMKELVRTLEETREELSRERSYVAQAFDNDEEMIRVKDELQKAEAQTKELEKNLAAKAEVISSLEKVIEDTEAQGLERNSKAEETEKAVAEKVAEIAALAKQLEVAKEEMHGTKAELEEIKIECNGKDSQLEVLKKELEEKVSELEEATREVSVKVAALGDMEKQVLEKEAELNNVKVENSKTTAELENTKKALEVKIEALKRTECEVQQTQASKELEKGNAEKIIQQAARTKDKEAEIREKAVELENGKSESARKISELEMELTECRKELKKLQTGDALAELEKQLEESTKALDKKNSQVITRNNTIKRLELSLAEKERLLSEMEKLPKEPNLRAKEELKTLRRRLVQADKEKEESREQLAKKEEKLEELRQELGKLKNDGDEKSAKFLRELQEARTELDEVKEDTKKKQEQIQSLKEKLDSQCLKNACLQTQLENEKRGLLEREKAVQEAKKELTAAKSSSATEMEEARKRLASTEEKVQELEDEVFTANETTSRIQDEVRRYENEIVPGLENKVKTLEEELLQSGERAKEAEEKLEKESNEARSRLEKRNEEIEEKVKEINELREATKNLDQEKFQEMDKLFQDLMSMQKTIEERNKTVDEYEQKLREANLKQGKSEVHNRAMTHQLKSEQEKSNEQIRTLTEQLKALGEDKSSLERRLGLVTSDAGKDKEIIADLKKVLEEQDGTLAEQGQALDERQNEMEILTTELQGWQEKCALITKELEKKKEEINCLKKQALVASDENKRLQSVQLEEMEEEIRKLKHDRSSLEAQLDKKDKEIQKANDSRDNTMKTMREAFEVAKAKKAEYEVKLATVREQCRQELKREMDEELRRTKRDFQRLLNDKDKSLEGIRGEKESVEKTLAVERAETSKTDSSASDPDTNDSTEAKSSVLRSSQKKTLKRNSSEITLAELKNQLSASKARKTGDSDEEFTPGSVRKTRSRASAKKAGRSSSCRSKRTTPAAKVDVLPTMDETGPSKAGGVAEKKKLFKDLQENTNSAGEENDKDSAQPVEETENIPPKASQSTTKKRRKLFQKPSAVAALLSPAITGSRDVKTEQESTKNIVARQLRPRAIKYN